MVTGGIFIWSWAPLGKSHYRAFCVVYFNLKRARNWIRAVSFFKEKFMSKKYSGIIFSQLNTFFTLGKSDVFVIFVMWCLLAICHGDKLIYIYHRKICHFRMLCDVNYQQSLPAASWCTIYKYQPTVSASLYISYRPRSLLCGC